MSDVNYANINKKIVRTQKYFDIVPLWSQEA